MERLTRRADFRAASRGKRAAAGGFVLQARGRADRDGARVGFTVSRQVGNAVERNRVRRRLREIVRLMAGDDMRAGHDYVLIGRRAALAAPFSQLRADLDATLGRIHAADAAAGRGGTGGSRDHALHEPGSPRPNPPPAPPTTPPRKPRRNLRDA